MNNYLPDQKVRIITLQIAADAETAKIDIFDEINELLNSAMADPDTHIADWRYVDPAQEDGYPEVLLSADPEEGEAFDFLDKRDIPDPSEAFQTGYMAYERNVGIMGNPYDTNKQLRAWTDWNDGWVMHHNSISAILRQGA